MESKEWKMPEIQRLKAMFYQELRVDDFFMDILTRAVNTGARGTKYQSKA